MGNMEERRGGQPDIVGMATASSSVPQTGAGGQSFSQMSPSEVDHRQDLSNHLQKLGNVLNGHHA
jgi:hypothetical protein